MFITQFIRTRNLFLIWARQIQYTSSHPIHFRSVSILSLHPHLEFSSGLSFSSFPTRTVHAFLSISVCATRTAPPLSSCLIWSPEKYLVAIIDHGATRWILSILLYVLPYGCKYLAQHPTVEYFSPYSSLNISEQASHIYWITTDKGWSSSLGLDEGLTKTHKKSAC